jgi:glycosyltransferase involved in cell wall biosynthesis
MRILQVAPFFSPKMGGSARIVFQIASYLANRGHRVTVLAGDFGLKEAQFTSNNGFEQVLLPSLVSKWGFYLTPNLIAWCRKHIEDFDVIHLHEVRTFQNEILHRFSKRRKIPYLVSAHGTLPIIEERIWAKRAFDKFFGSSLLSGAARLIAVSRFEIEQFLAAGIKLEQMRLIPNGLDLDEFKCLPTSGSFRTKLGILNRETKILLFLGRLHRIKGLRYLLESFAHLAVADNALCLAIVGPDEGEQSDLQSLAVRLGIGERTLFPGPLYRRERLAALVDADVLVYPSKYEIFGLVPFEALLCGTPVVVSEVGGLGAFIREAGAGYLVPYGDSQALAAGISQALNCPSESVRMVKAGQTFIRERLDWNVIISELEAIFGEVMNESST